MLMIKTDTDPGTGAVHDTGTDVCALSHRLFAYLIGAVGSAQLLDSLVCRPGQLNSEMHPPALVGNGCRSMQRYAGAGSV